MRISPFKITGIAAIVLSMSHIFGVVAEAKANCEQDAYEILSPEQINQFKAAKISFNCN